MQLDGFDLVSALQALPETEPIEIDGIQFSPNTCQAGCAILTVNIVQTICIGATC